MNRMRRLLVVVSFFFAIGFAESARALCIPCIESFLEAARRQAEWDRANTAWFMANGFDASIGRQSNDHFAWDMPMRAPGEIHQQSAKTYYDLGNQVPFTVRMGPAVLHHRGADVRRIEGWRIKTVDPGDFGEPFHTCDTSFNWLHAYSGWNNELMIDPDRMNEGDGGATYRSGWVKGFLTRTAVRTWINDFPDTCGRALARYVYRYQYHAPDGSTVLFFQRPREIPSQAGYGSGCASAAIPAPEPGFFYSTDGNATLDARNKCKPVIRWSDGSHEEFHAATTRLMGSDVGQAIAPPFEPSCSATELNADLRRIDRHGNITTFRYSTNPDGSFVETMVDPQGREVVLTYDLNALGMQRLLSVETPSIGSAPRLRYTIHWQQRTVQFNQIWPDIPCAQEFGADPGCATAIPLDVVTSIVLPDGRQYLFEYGPWGNLTRATEPAGVVHEYDYGDHTNNLDYASAVVPLVNRIDSVDLCGAMWSGGVINMQARGVIRERVRPEGLGAGKPSFEKQRRYVLRKLAVPGCAFDGIGAATAGPDGCSQVWMESTEPDGSITKKAQVTRAMPGQTPNDSILAVPPNVPVDVHGRSLADETWAGGILLAGHYNGNKDTGQLWYESEFVKLVRSRMAIPAALRATKAVTYRDGLTHTTNFTYGQFLDLDPGTGVESRNTAAVTSICLFPGVATQNGCAGAPLIRTEMTYVNYFETFFQANLVNLAGTKRVYGPSSSEPLSETIYRYDEVPAASSGRPASVLDSTRTLSTPRGNVTSTTQRVSATKSISTRSRYFDHGALQSTTDPNGRTTTYAPDFRLCSATQTLTSTITNALGHVTKSVTDCWSDLTLTATDANGQSIYTQYDHLARPVEVAQPGDVLTALPRTGAQAFTRDPGAPTGAGSAPGQAKVTTWTEYLGLGVVGQQRTVEHTRDGSPNGLYKKTFTDGLDRVLQTRTETDASRNGLPEVVATTVYDSVGRVAVRLAPCFAAASDVRTAHCGTAGVSTNYDSLGRELTITLPGNLTTTNTYANSMGLWLKTSVNPRGFTTKMFTNFLGHEVRVDRQSDRCGGFCSTTSTYDAAGRVLTQTDPGNNTITWGYDNLGRRISMLDPDLGSWSYKYDDNGNLTEQLDAKLQKSVFKYDVLNRVTLKDFPPEGPSLDDVAFYYDGSGPTPPADNPVPTIASFSPALVEAGGPAFTLTVNGSNFITGAVVRVNGQSRPTTFVSSQQLQAAIPSTDIGVAATLSFTVLNPPPGGGASNAASYTVNGRPAVTLTSPTNGQTFSPAPATIALRATVTDDASGATVTYYNGATAIGSSSTAPTYPFDWTNVAAGQYTLKAQVQDLHGSVAASTTVTVTVAAAPTVTMTAPAGGQSFTRPVDITLAANASSSIGITKVQFFRGTTLVGEDATAPYSVVWVNADAGTYVLSAKAFDTKGNATQSAGVTVVVGDRPSVGISRPAQGAVFFAPATIVIEAFANDADGIKQVEFFVGTTRLGIDTTFPYRFDWTNVPMGAYRLTAVAIDWSNVSNTSAPVDITVANAPPAVTVTAPREGEVAGVAPAAIAIDATATDSDGIVKVEFFHGTTKLGEDATAPYRFIWSGVAAGTYGVKAVATDGTGRTSTSTTVTFSVAAATGMAVENPQTAFSATSNPAGRWSYGYRAAGGTGAFTLYPAAATPWGAGANAWRPAADCCPFIANNNTGATYTYAGSPTVIHPADMLNLHPGTSDVRSVLRWTAPVSGVYRILGRFQGIDTAGTTTDGAIHHNGLALFSANVSGYGTIVPFSITREIAAGETLELSVGDGTNNNYNNDSTGLVLTIVPHSGDSVLSFSRTANPAGQWTYGSRTGSGAFTAYTTASAPYGTGATAWRTGADCCPQVVANNTMAAYTYPNATSVVHPSDVLNLHPGLNDQRSVLRWTATVTGTYRIAGRFEGIDTAGTTTDAMIQHAATPVFTRDVSGYGTKVPFLVVRNVLAGEVIDISVGDGANNTHSNDSTGVAVSITPTTAAGDVIAGFSSTNNPAVPWSYGSLPGGVFTRYTVKSLVHGPGVTTWAKSSGICCPTVAGNLTGTAYNASSGRFTLPPDLVALLGWTNERSVVRWTAPAAGTYYISGRFEHIATYNQPTDLSIVHNGTNLFSTILGTYGGRAPFYLVRTVAAGDTIDFTVGSAGNFGGDALGLGVTIDTVQ
jgi:YD repeat-containing protein